MALLSLALGTIAGVLIAWQPSTQPSAPLSAPPSAPPSVQLPVSPVSPDSPKAAAAIGGSPYLDLIKHYRDGEYEVAVKGMALLREGRDKDRVFDALESLEFTAAGVKASLAGQLAVANVWAIVFPAAAALHLETGYALMKAGDFVAGRDHVEIAHQIVDYPRFLRMMRILPDLQDAQARFRRDIHLGVVWALQTDPVLDRLIRQLEHVRDVYPGDGEVALAIGSFEEYGSSSLVIRAERPPTAVTAVGPWRLTTQQARLKNAEKYYRDALKFDSSLVEARVRLGRVLQQRGLLPDARTELEAVFAAPDAPPPLRYLASIFLVDVLDALGQTAASFARARDLVRRYPECQSAHLALSRAYEARGQRDAALTALAPLWKEEASRSCADPWWSYYNGQTWRLPELFGSLRERVGSAK